MAEDDPAALDAFRALELAGPDDALARLHRRRLEAGARGTVVDLSLAREDSRESGAEAAVTR